jgi:magnesium chelatase subunit D
VDCESGPVRLRLADALAQALGGEYLSLDDLSVSALTDSVRALRVVA